MPAAARARALTDHIDLYHSKAERVLRGIPDESFDAIITDPPYEVDLVRQSGRSWDRTGIAFSVPLWRDALRVVKPGANLVAFGSPRSFHRLVCAVEDAGWEIRDTARAWVKSYGFPKALEVQQLLHRRGRPDLAERFAGAQNVLKPAYEPLLIARRPIEGKTLADNIIEHGVGGLGIDACRIPSDDDRARTPGTASAGDIIHMSRGLDRSVSHPGGRWPTNALFVHGHDCSLEPPHCEPGCPVAQLNEQHPGAEKYFPVFHYAGRASKSERPIVDGIEHHTVKPLSVVTWTVDLGCPVDGMRILDLFAGTGTLAEAVLLGERGHHVTLIEQERDYLPLIERRVHRAGLALRARAAG